MLSAREAFRYRETSRLQTDQKEMRRTSSNQKKATVALLTPEIDVKANSTPEEKGTS